LSEKHLALKKTSSPKNALSSWHRMTSLPLKYWEAFLNRN